MNYRSDIQILRGVAVIFVVLFHLEIGGFQSGFLGVDVFFVISGFLMAVLYKNDKVLEFFSRRAKRLLPAYFVTITLTTLVTAIIATPVEFNSVKEQSIFALFFTSNLGFWLENSYFSKAEFKPLLHLWSLGVEIQFYFLVPVLFLVFKKSRIACHSIFIFSLFTCLATLYVSTKSSFFLTPFRVWEFLLGYYVVKYFSDSGNVKVSPKYQLIGISALIALMLIPLMKVDGSSKDIIFGHPGMFALIITSLTAVVLICGLPTRFEQSIFGRTLELFGKYSYSIYLVHFPVIVLFLYEPLSGTILKTKSFSQLIYLVIMIFAAAILMYRLVESSILLRTKKSIIVLLSGGLIISLIVSGLIQSLKIDNEQRTIYDAWTDRSEYRCGLVNRIKDPFAKVCRLNKEEQQNSVLLVGNSHADSIKTSFVEAASKNFKNVWFFTSNTPLMSELIGAETVVNEAVKIKANEVFLHFSPNAVPNQMIESVIRAARNHNIKVSFIMPVPIWNISIPKSLILNKMQNTELPKQSLDDYREQNKDLINFLMTLKYDNFRVLEVAPVFCSPNCAIQNINGKPLYFDDSHLTLTGSDLLMKSMVKWLN